MSIPPKALSTLLTLVLNFFMCFCFLNIKVIDENEKKIILDLIFLI